MASTTSYLLLLLPLLLLPFAAAVDDECSTASHGKCYDRHESLRLKLIAIAVILIASLTGISAPLFSRSLPALHPDRDLFVIVKAFASGVILATGYMHVLPDAFANLTSPCLPEKPWQEFPFTTFVAMLAAIFTLMVDSFMTAYYTRVRTRPAASSAAIADHESPLSDMTPVVHGHGFQIDSSKGVDQSAEPVLQRNRIIAQVLEMGIVVHSVVIGLSMGASQNPCTIRPLVAALCFHQLFEGMGLGGCILQAEYGFRMKATMAFFFATTTPFGVALGIGLSKVYRDNSPTALIVVGLLNACSAGLLHYTALVDLLAADFMGSKLQSSIKLQVWSFAAVLMGAGGMSLMAKWA